MNSCGVWAERAGVEASVTLACKVYMMADLISVLLYVCVCRCVCVCVCGPLNGMLVSDHTDTVDFNPHV